MTEQERQRIRDHFETDIFSQFGFAAGEVVAFDSHHAEGYVGRPMRAAVIAFLKDHFRYYTMHSNNGLHSYAACIKIQGIPFPNRLFDNKYAMLGVDEWQQRLTDMISKWQMDDANKGFEIGTNGRSSGYMVLYAKGTSRGVDQDADFDECYQGEPTWDDEDLRGRVALVQRFDTFVADVAIEFAEYCDTFVIEDRVVQVPHTIQVLVPKTEVNTS